MDLKKIMGRLASFPEQSISLYDGDGRVVRKTYPEVHGDILGAMERLRSWGVEPGMRVGVLATNCYEFVLYDMALLELKCTSLAFPEEFGSKTSQQLVEDYRLNILLLSEKDAWPTLVPCEWTAYMDAEIPASTRVRKVAPSDSDGEYTPTIAFSSGSSGKIKGMIINPLGVEDTIAKFHALFDIGHKDSLLVFLPLSSFQQRLMIYAAFFYGFDLYLVKPSQLFAAFKDFRPTLCLAPPLLYESIHNQFMKAVNVMSPTRRRLVGALTKLARVAPSEALRERLRRVCYGRIYSSLGGHIRVLWTGMAPIRRSTLDFFADARIPLYEAYGLTELGVIASNSSSHNRIGSVGRPIDEGSVRLADDGEIIVRQRNINTKGYVYYDDADEAQTYLDANTVATGDIGRFDEDGYLYLLGRKKEHIVTSQGYKVHPELLEGQINVCPGVERSVVFGNGHHYLVALVSIQQGADPQARQRIERRIMQINRQLPPVGRIQKFHLTPEQFTIDNGLLTRNLKLNRRGLLKRFEADLLGDGDSNGSNAERTYDAPQTEAERMLAEIWQDVLKTKRVGRTEKFLDLGGDSLLATQVLSRVRDAFQIDLPFATFFETSDLAGLAKCIEDFERVQPGSVAPRIERAPREGELPLSYAQQRLWFLQQLEPDNTSYNEIAAVRLSGRLDVRAFERAFAQVIARHEILRTTFEAVDGRPVQVINPDMPLAVRLVGMDGVDGDALDAEVRRLAAEMTREPFDLTKGPLMRVTLLRRAPDEHVLLLLMHHIISDGWSRAVFVREVASLYEAFAAGRPASLPALPLQYADFANWQREWLGGERLEELLGYWKQQLSGAPPVLELPTDRPYTHEKSHAGGSYYFTIDAATAGRLKALCRDEGVTLFMLLLACFQVQLSRYSGQSEVVVGTPIANRVRAELEPLIGFFVNTLVLRTDLSGDPTLRELLARVKEMTLGAYAHQDVPFEKLVEELQPDRRLTRTPLFQVMFILQNAPADALKLPGLELTLLQLEHVASKFELTLSFEEAAGELRGTVVYNADLFDASTVERMAEHFRALVEGVASDPSLRVSSLPLLGDAERRTLVGEWSGERASYGPPRCVHELFEEQASRTPDGVAVVYEGVSLTYAELNARANRLARRLLGMGAGPETAVGVLLARQGDAIVAVLGALKAGAAYVPLEPMHPVARWADILADARPAVVVSERSLAEQLPAGATPLLLLDEEADSLSKGSADDLGRVAAPENLAYVIYTSGSTGRPKGVGVEHRQLYNYLRGIERRIAPEPGASYAAVSTLAADLGHTVIFGALCVGGGAVLHLVAQERAGDAEALGAYFERHGIDYLKIVPSHLRALLEVGGRVIPRRGLVLGGEALTRELLRTVADAQPGCEVFNHYGPTETTVGVLTHHAGPGTPMTKSGTVPLGRPLPNTTAYVLDAKLGLAPAGVAGELYLGGACVSRGYVNRPGQTAERFVPDPFSAGPGARLYRTGDLVRHLPDGQLEFLGRADDQVKIRGYRVEPAEVAEALRQHEAVRDAYVLAYGESAGDRRLSAYVTPLPNVEPPTASELRDFARERLPEFMVPSVWAVLEELPLTANGKVDRRALPSPEQIRPESASEYVAPRTVDEEVLAGLWASILRVERVGLNDNFFDLGGHSLLATQLVSHIRRALNVEIPLRAVFEAPTVAGQAERIEAMRWAAQAFEPVTEGAAGDWEVGEL